MTSKVPTQTQLSSYPALVAAVRREIALGQKAIEHLQAQTYWNVGKHISQHLLLNKHRAGYGEQLFERLADSSKIHRNTLHQALKFYEEYPIVHARVQLPWSHYRALLSVEDPARRRRIEKEAVARKLTTRQLEARIRKDAGKKGTNQLANSETRILPLIRGAYKTYKILQTFSDGRVRVDCGFNVRRTIAKDSVTEETLGDEAGYTYKATVEEIIDADTLWLEIDIGFDTSILQKLRLRGIDAPELNTLAGKRAKAFVQKVLKGLEFVVIKTYKPDKFDRYLTDLFYLRGEIDPVKVSAVGVFLNQQLLDEGLAQNYEG